MPRFDLRQNNGTLDPLASFKALAVMCHPHNRVQREKMLGNIQLETGVGHLVADQPRVKHSWRKFDVLTDERQSLALFC
jgi:hypothetical protein